MLRANPKADNVANAQRKGWTKKRLETGAKARHKGLHTLG